MSLHLTITSSAKNAAHYVERCLRSVREQTHEDWTHYYVVDQGSEDNTFSIAWDASYPHDLERRFDPKIDVRRGTAPPGPLDTTLENLLPIWRSLPPEEVIVWLDGDDALLIPKALEIVAKAHERGAWATWGQFVWSSGEVGFAGPIGPCPRREPWRATHLKTFRAGLVQRIRPEELTLGFARDRAVMLAVCEQAAERGVFIPQLLYLYNAENSFMKNAPEAEQRAEWAAVEKIHAFPRYARLERL